MQHKFSDREAAIWDAIFAGVSVEMRHQRASSDDLVVTAIQYADRVVAVLRARGGPKTE